MSAVARIKMLLEKSEAEMAPESAVSVAQADRVPPLILFVPIEERQNPQLVSSDKLVAAWAIVLRVMIAAAADSSDEEMRIGFLVMWFPSLIVAFLLPLNPLAEPSSMPEKEELRS